MPLLPVPSHVSMCVHVRFLLCGAFLSLGFIFFGCLLPQLSNDFKKVMMFLVHLTFFCWDEWGVLSSFQHCRGTLKSPGSYSDCHTKQQMPGPPDASCMPNEGKIRHCFEECPLLTLYLVLLGG